MPSLVNKRELARILDISLPTLGEMIERHGDSFPVERRGSNGIEWQFDPEAVVAFVRAQREQDAAEAEKRAELLSQFGLPLDQAAPADQAGQKPTDILTAWRARKIHHEMAKEAGELVWKATIRQQVTNEVLALRQFLTSAPASIMRRHGIPDAVIRTVSDAMLEQLAEFRRKMARSGLAEPPPEAEDHAA